MKTNTMVDTKWKLQSLIIKILSMSPSTIRRGARGSTTVWRNSSTTRTDKVVYKWQHDLFVNRFPLIKISPDVGLFTHVFSFACFPWHFDLFALIITVKLKNELFKNLIIFVICWTNSLLIFLMKISSNFFPAIKYVNSVYLIFISRQ